MSEIDSLIERLQENLPVCPFDPKAPKNDLQPEDPCIVCGGLGTEGAENVCRGADTRIMDEAATALTALIAERDALEARCKALEEALTAIKSGEAFREQRFAEDDDAEYFLRAQRSVQQFADSTLNAEGRAG